MQIVCSCCADLFLGFACVVLQCGVTGWWSGAFGLRSWLVLFVVLLGFGGCGVVVWCQRWCSGAVGLWSCRFFDLVGLWGFPFLLGVVLLGLGWLFKQVLAGSLGLV